VIFWEAPSKNHPTFPIERKFFFRFLTKATSAHLGLDRTPRDPKFNNYGLVSPCNTLGETSQITGSCNKSMDRRVLLEIIKNAHLDGVEMEE